MIGVTSQNILADESTADAPDAAIAKMARSYNETTLAQLKSKLTEKLTQKGGTNLKELTGAVDGVYSFADERRAGLIAKAESFRAANFANKEAWRQSSVVKTLKWYTAEDDHVCQFCAALDDTVIGIDDNFYDAGAKIAGARRGNHDGQLRRHWRSAVAPGLPLLCPAGGYLDLGLLLAGGTFGAGRL
jgi:hypothetical protein